MTNAKMIARVRELNAKATPGPWDAAFRCSGQPYPLQVGVYADSADPPLIARTERRSECHVHTREVGDENATLIAESRTLIVQLADALEQQTSGWCCERHPELDWPHDDCAGAGCPGSARSFLIQNERKRAEQALRERDALASEAGAEVLRFADALEQAERINEGVERERLALLVECNRLAEELAVLKQERDFAQATGDYDAETYRLIVEQRDEARRLIWAALVDDLTPEDGAIIEGWAKKA